MSSADAINRLAAEASGHRDRLGDAVSELKTRLDPDALFDEAYETASVEGRKLVNKSKDMVTAHPVAIGAAVAAIGLALLARNTLSNATVDLGDTTADYTDYDDEYDTDSVAPPSGLSAAGLQDSIAKNPLLSMIIGVVAGAALSLFGGRK